MALAELHNTLQHDIQRPVISQPHPAPAKAPV
jgi:hypothetical protein